MEKPKATPDVEYAMRWWNVLSAEQMVAALYGDQATPDQATAAKKMYAQLDDATKAKVNSAAAEIYGDGGYTSVGQWWETLDCRLMRIAAGDGNTHDPTSPYCAHYPGSGAAKILSADAKAHVDMVGIALLGRSDPGVYPPLHGTWSTAGPPMIELTVEADYSFSLTVSPDIFDRVYSGTISVTATTITATITAATTNGIAMTPQEIALIAGPHELSYSVAVTDTGATLTVMGDALQVLVGSAEVTLQKQP
ncbi:MAG: hypothetical protein OXJ62_05105 [Spirochaetaceae bacterium]|nr:hypothetical protein [Spirochaetaceae bacterium]